MAQELSHYANIVLNTFKCYLKLAGPYLVGMFPNFVDAMCGSFHTKSTKKIPTLLKLAQKWTLQRNFLTPKFG